ncbi:MAG: hypothetical protein E8A46_11005 [Bradyrhizobium sp.]|uniref:hypothetical protein n=1 Tax=Bradyrhizobium sp. TaxID=376 RepID=UPI001223FDC4|nr:hypothetical protein [Bradyrhizobium sp.]THD53476.1 MAG: hypothetical protein E8A46_11005 [Bradyrhizobium sp.]
MDILPNSPICKPTRYRLPDRRASQNIAFERDNLKYHMTVGLYPDGRIGEVFLNAEHVNSLLDVLAHDGAILASLALQFGCPLETIRHALKRDGQGIAASPIGAALDLIEASE